MFLGINVIRLILIAILFPPGNAISAQSNVESVNSHLANVSLSFVQPSPAPKPPDYAAIKHASDVLIEKRHQDELEALRHVPAPTPVFTPAPAPQVVYTPPVQPMDHYKAWIYNEESGNNPTRWNTSGCLGLGQACPASKLLAVCPHEDYACEDAWFTNYMVQRYGSWYNAYAFHIKNNWW